MLRMSTKSGRNVLARRRLKGRHVLTVSEQRTGKAQKRGLRRAKARRTASRGRGRDGHGSMERRLRLRGESDFRRIRAAGRAFGGPLLTLLVMPNGLPHNRYGIIAGKRVGKAVTRNLVKRRLREVLRRLDREGRIPPGHDLAVIARPRLAETPFDLVGEAVAAQLRRAKLLEAPAGLPVEG